MARWIRLFPLITLAMVLGCSSSPTPSEDASRIDGTPPLSSSTSCGEAGNRQPCLVELVNLTVVPVTLASPEPPPRVIQLLEGGGEIIRANIRVTNEGQEALTYDGGWELATPPSDDQDRETVLPAEASEHEMYAEGTVPAWVQSLVPAQEGERYTLAPGKTVQHTVFFYPARKELAAVLLTSDWFKPGFEASLGLQTAEDTQATRDASSGQPSTQARPLPKLRIKASFAPSRPTNGAEIIVSVTVSNVGTLAVSDLVVRFDDARIGFPVVASTASQAESDRDPNLTSIDPRPKKISGFGAAYHFGELAGGKTLTVTFKAERWIASVAQLGQAQTLGNTVSAMDGLDLVAYTVASGRIFPESP